MENILYDASSLPLKTEYTFERPRIHALLHSALKMPLTMVVGGTGHGKTQAVSNFLDSIDQNVVWLQLSGLDNDVSRLWERIVYGLRPYIKELAQSLRRLGYPETVSAYNEFLRLLAKAMEHGRPFVIVMDDFHLIHEPTIISFVETLVAARVHNLSVILISRMIPSPNFSGMLLKGQIMMIGENELRFTLEETKAYYEKLHGFSLSDQDLLDIHSKTEGWILAIHLIGLSIQKKGAYTQTREFFIDIFKLIQHEVYAVISPKLQHLLVKLALLEVIPRTLFIELTEQDIDSTQEMSQKNLLIRYEAHSDSYILHPLLRDFLLERKSLLSDEDVTVVYRTAAQWFEKADRKLEAVSLYARCGEHDKAFKIVLSMDRMLPQSTIDFLLQFIENAPETLRQKPIVQVVKALYLLARNQIDRAFALLAEMRVRYEQAPRTDEIRAILGEIYILLALISIMRQGDEFVELFHLADSHLASGSVLVDYRLNIAEGINISGIKCPEAGTLNRKRENMMRAMPVASRVMNGCLYGAEYLNATESCYMEGDIQGAERNAFEAIIRARQRDQYGIECMANFFLMRIYVSTGDYAKASALLALIEENMNAPESTSSLVLYDILKGWVYVKFNMLDEVPQWILSDEMAKKMLSPVIVGREYLVRSDALLARGEYQQLLAFMEHTDIIYTERGILYAVIQNEITRAIVYHCLGNHLESVRSLNRAYTLSNPNNLIIQYIEYGRQMRATIAAARRSGQCAIPVDWLDSIYTKSSTYAKQLSRVVLAFQNERLSMKKSAVALSKREKELIIHLSNGLTRSEMASHLGVSINTVKSILQSAYNKLGASNSADAVRIASAQKIVE